MDFEPRICRRQKTNYLSKHLICFMFRYLPPRLCSEIMVSSHVVLLHVKWYVFSVLSFGSQWGPLPRKPSHVSNHSNFASFIFITRYCHFICYALIQRFSPSPGTSPMFWHWSFVSHCSSCYFSKPHLSKFSSSLKKKP